MAKLGSPTGSNSGTTKSGLSLIEDSSAVEDYRGIIIGPPGVGKTFACMTASKYWGKPGKLKDMLHVAFDTNPGAGLGEQGYVVPTLNVRKLLSSGRCKTVLDVMTVLSSECRAFIESNSDKVTVVIDTLSALDKMLVEYWERNCPITKSGNRDTMQMWVLLRNTHLRFYRDMNLLNANVIMCCHAKAVVEAEGKMGEEQAKRIRATGLTDITLDITGGALQLYTGDPSFIFWMTCKKVGPKKYERKFKTVEFGGAIAKNRWQKSLEEEEEADLGKVIEKVRKASGGK